MNVLAHVDMANMLVLEEDINTTQNISRTTNPNERKSNESAQITPTISASPCLLGNQEELYNDLDDIGLGWENSSTSELDSSYAENESSSTNILEPNDTQVCDALANMGYQNWLSIRQEWNGKSLGWIYKRKVVDSKRLYNQIKEGTILTSLRYITKMGWLGSMLGAFAGTALVSGANSISRDPLSRRPWMHLLMAGFFGYCMYNLEYVTEAGFKANDELRRTWERKCAKKDTIYNEYLNCLAEAEKKMSEDPHIISQRSKHQEHVINFYQR